MNRLRNLATIVLAFFGVVTVMKRGHGEDPTATQADRPAVEATTSPLGPAGVRASTPSHAGPSGSGDHGQFADRASQIPRTGWKDIALRVKAEMAEDRVSILSSSVAFAALLSLFPLMIAGISIYGLLLDPTTVADHIGAVQDFLPRDAASLITDQLQALASADGTALGLAALVGLLGALWGASAGMGMLIDAVNIAYDETDDRGFVRKKALALGLTLGAIVFMVVAVLLLAVPAGVLELGGAVTLLLNLARFAILGLFVLSGLAVLYRMAPDRQDAKWRWLTPGASIGTVLWLIGSVAFSLFVDTFGSYNETYGSIAGVVVLMLWLRLSAMIVLVGAETNAEIERQTIRDTTTGPAKPVGQRGAEPADTLPPAMVGT